VHDLRLRTCVIQRQDLAQQLAQLDAASCTKIYREKVAARLSSGPSSSALGALDAGNVLMVTSTDRLARNTRDLLNILYAVKKSVRAFDRSPIRWSTPLRRLPKLSMPCRGSRLAGSAIVSLSAAGLQAKAGAVKFGHRAALTHHQQAEALQRLADGDTQHTVAALVGVSQATPAKSLCAFLAAPAGGEALLCS